MNRVVALLVSLGFSATFLGSSVSAQSSAAHHAALSSGKHVRMPSGAMRMAGEMLVKFRPDVTGTEIEGLSTLLGATLIENHRRSGVRRLAVSEGSALEQALTSLRASPLVESVGYNYVVHALGMPNDPDYPLMQWNLFNSASGIWAESAWDMSTKKGQGIVVAIIDTGVAYENFGPYFQAPDLNKTFVAPKNFVDPAGHANDDNGHGTHIAGTIAQDTNNGLATAGIAYQASIMPIKVLDWAGNGSAAALNEAIYYAVDNGAHVINLSLGFANTGKPNASGQVCTEIVGLNSALQYAYDHQVVVVAASGNEGVNFVNCPAAYPTVISVGATRYDGQRTYYSNGGDALDIVAPGGDMFVDQNSDGEPDGILQVSFCNDPGVMFDSWVLDGISLYGSFCTAMHAGTSMSAPHVAATVALMLAENPALTPELVRSYLQSTARDYGVPGWDPNYGWGLLDASAAVAAIVAPPPPPPSSAGKLQGFVTDASDGKPIIAATITLRLKGETFRVTTANDGSFSFSALPFGNYRVSVDANTYHQQHAGLTIGQGSSIVVNDFALTRMRNGK